MSKFVLMSGEDEYEEYIAASMLEDKDVFVRNKIDRKVLREIFKLHNAWPLNKKVEMPFKRMWFPFFLNKNEFAENDKIFFLFYESFHLSYSNKYLDYLRKKYRNAKFCYVFLNPADQYNLEKLSKVRTKYDLILTFFEDDAVKYGFSKPKYFPYKLPVENTKEGEKSDVFFVGADKGRLEKIIRVYEELKERGLKCLFYIVGVPKEKQLYNEDIRYNQKLTYQEVLEKVKGTKCVLEILKDDDMYTSIREYEAFQYNKRLLTMNRRILEEPFYNSEFIQVIEPNKTIDVDFLTRENESTGFVDEFYWSFSSMKKCIEENLQ